jgi:alpha-amylase
VFVDNHDNPRFLYNFPGNNVGLKQSLVFSLTSRGIPFVYYGDEQYFSGGNDPACRESMWPYFNTNSDIYQMIAKVNKQRKKSAIWNNAYVERYVDDTFFAFSRGQFLVALTNNGGTQQRQVTYSPFANGTVVCNIFYPTTDCQTTNNGVNVYLLNGESKIYVPQASLASTAALGEESVEDLIEAMKDFVEEAKETGEAKAKEIIEGVEGFLESFMQ